MKRYTWFGAVVVPITLAFMCVSGVVWAQNLLSNPLIPQDRRIASLEQMLATQAAEMVGLRADLAICSANTEQARREYQSLVLTNDVANAIKKLEEQFPGSKWTWNAETHRIVPVIPKESKP